MVLIIWLLIISAVLGYGLILNGKNKTFKKEAEDLDQQLVKLNNKITLILILKDRLGKISQVIDDRQDLSRPLNSFFTNIPAGITLTRVNLSQRGLNVAGTGDILSISQLTKNYTAQKQDWYQGATLESLIKNKKDVSFTFSLLIEL